MTPLENNLEVFFIMNGFFNILRHELFSLFISPATYVSSFYFLCLLGIGFRFFIEAFGTTDWILPHFLRSCWALLLVHLLSFPF